ASVRVDMRGSGDADGILEDEYLPLEQQDGAEVVAWLASQSWCSGKVGIIGKSWGGFNGLQIATLRPPELGAVISVASTDDRYADDVHYMGGCVLAWTMLPWASTMLAYTALPPDPAVVGDAWRATWLDRMERTPPFIDSWLSHQLRDDFWRQGSVCEDFGAIVCPVYMVGGWTDAYRNAILRFLDVYEGPAKGLIGPWAHDYPEDGVPGPAIGFLQEAVRWWDHWLKGIDNGIMTEPKLRVYMPEARPPQPGYETFAGRWLGLDGWPAKEVSARQLPLGEAGTLGGAGTLGEAGTPGAELRIKGTGPTAVDPGQWGGHGGATEFPGDQRPEDAVSLCFDTAPLHEPMEILGVPSARLKVSSDRPLALVVVRLCDVWPDGRSTLITRGLRNLAHSPDDAAVEPLVPREHRVVEVRLNSIAYGIPEDHRLRLAVSPTYWPWAWPSPEPVTLGLITGQETVLELPVYGGGAEHSPPQYFGVPERAPGPAHEVLVAASSRATSRDVATGLVETTSYSAHGHRLSDDGLEYEERETDIFRMTPGDPLSAEIVSEREGRVARGSWRTTVRTRSTMSSTETSFLVTNILDAFEGERRVFTKTWHAIVPRDGI
ncbi:MAG: CocE/NonD family hydrolase, partial [Acidimicrobiales bacterium]